MDKLEFTEKEKAIIKEVRWTNFYTTAAPLSAFHIGVCHFLMKKGYISTTKPFLRYFLFGFGGYILGILSLPRKIREGLINQAPDGAFAQFTKKMEGMSPEERKDYLYKLRTNALEEGAAGAVNPGNQTPPAFQEGTSSYQGNKDIFPQPLSVPDSSLSTPKDSTPAPQQGFSYSKQRLLQNDTAARSTPPPLSLATPSAFTDDDVPPSKLRTGTGRRNKYGDEME